MTFTYTPDQAAAIVAKWNELATAENNVSAKNAHLIFHDNSDDEMEDRGYTTIEVGRFQSKTGNPATFEIHTSDVELED